MECVRDAVDEDSINDTQFNVSLADSQLKNVLSDETAFPAANLTESFLHQCQTKPNTALLSQGIYLFMLKTYLQGCAANPDDDYRRKTIRIS